MPKSSSDILSDYQKMKEKQSENKIRDLLIKAGNLISDHAVTGVAGIQDVLGGDTDIGKAISDASGMAEIKKFGLSGFVEGLGNVVAKVQAFSKKRFGKNEDYAKQAGVVNGIVGVVGLLDSEGKNLQNSEDDKKGSLAKALIQFTKFGRMAASVGAQAFKYNRLLHSSLDFSYWLETKLVKRRMLQEELLVLNNVAKELDLVINMDEIAPEGFDALRSNLFYSSNELMKEQLDNLSVTAYGEKLGESIKKLEDVFIKNYTNTASFVEKTYFSENKELIAFLVGKSSSDLQTSPKKAGENQFFDEKRVLAFVNHLEQQHALDLLRQREELIKNRVIAEYDNQDEHSKKKIDNLLILDFNLEKDLNDKLGNYNPSFKQFAQDRSATDTEKAHAQHINTDYKKGLDSKVEVERKALIGKTLMLVAAGLLVAGALAFFFSLGPAVVVPLVICSAILFFVGKKFCPTAAQDLITDVKEFWGKFLKEFGILTLKGEMKNEREMNVLAKILPDEIETTKNEVSSEYDYENEDYDEELIADNLINSNNFKRSPRFDLHADEEDQVITDEEMASLLTDDPEDMVIEDDEVLEVAELHSSRDDMDDVLIETNDIAPEAREDVIQQVKELRTQFYNDDDYVLDDGEVGRDVDPYQEEVPAQKREREVSVEDEACVTKKFKGVLKEINPPTFDDPNFKIKP